MTESVNPRHYRHGPTIRRPNQPEHQLEAIEVIRWIQDPRLANAMKYIWRVAFGGKADNHMDIRKAIWYLTDWLDHDTSPRPPGKA